MASITEAFDSNVTLPCMRRCSLMCVFSGVCVGGGGVVLGEGAGPLSDRVFCLSACCIF